MWDTTGEKNLTKKKLPRLIVVLYVSVEWISKGVQTPVGVWLGKMVSNDANCQKDNWGFLF